MLECCAVRERFDAAHRAAAVGICRSVAASFSSLVIFVMMDSSDDSNHIYTPSNNLASEDTHESQGHAPPASLLICHAVAGRLSLSNESHDELLFDGSVPIPIAAALISLAGNEFKTREAIAALQGDLAGIKHDVADLLAGAKYVLLDPSRISYSNDAIIADLNKYLKKHAQNNSFTAFFANENSSFRKVMNAGARQQISYAKTTLKNLWISTTIDESTAISTSEATALVTKTMVGTSDAVGTKDTARMLIVRRFLRERQERLQNAKPKKVAAIASNNKRRRRDNFDTATLDPPVVDEEEDEADEVKALWSDLDSWLREKAEGLYENDAKKKKTHASSVENFAEAQPRGWGKTFKEEKWAKFYEECVANELVLFPHDSIPLIPRQQSQPQSNIAGLSGPTPSTPASRTMSSFNWDSAVTPVVPPTSRSLTPLATLSNGIFTTPSSGSSNATMHYLHHGTIPTTQAYSLPRPSSVQDIFGASQRNGQTPAPGRPPSGFANLLHPGSNGLSD
ncbi:hypothetical protein C8R42DRAFT_727983 [Lentinula raphanica]|nr:hypothetical protein C8R42DRAFT_727983 [Lentinula raphanica]